MADEEEYIMFLVEREDGKFMIAGKDQGKAMIKPSKEFSTNLEAGSEFEELHKKLEQNMNKVIFTLSNCSFRK